MTKNLENRINEKENNLMSSYLDLADKALDSKEAEKSMCYLMKFKIIYNTRGIYDKKLDERYENLFSRYKVIRYENE